MPRVFVMIARPLYLRSQKPDCGHRALALLGPAPNLAFYLGVPVISLVDTILLLLNYISLLLHLHQIQSSKCSLNMPPSVRDAHCTVYSYSCIRYGHIPYEKRALTVWYGFCLYPYHILYTDTIGEEDVLEQVSFMVKTITLINFTY